MVLKADEKNGIGRFFRTILYTSSMHFHYSMARTEEKGLDRVLVVSQTTFFVRGKLK